MTESEFLDYVETIAIGRGGISVENMRKFKNLYLNTQKENEQLKNALLTEQQKNINLRKEIEEFNSHQVYKDDDGYYVHEKVNTLGKSYFEGSVNNCWEWIEKQNLINSLRVKIEELTTELGMIQNENKELKKKVDELNSENLNLVESNDFDIQEYHVKNDELKAQIEKMKCCENCLHHNEGDCQSEHTYDCKYWNKQNKNDFWELGY